MENNTKLEGQVSKVEILEEKKEKLDKEIKTLRDELEVALSSVKEAPVDIEKDFVDFLQNFDFESTDISKIEEIVKKIT
jgi:hypothetical protein